MNVASSGPSLPVAWRNSLRKYLTAARMPTNPANILATFGGRGTAISGSRPTTIVSLWCRVWLHRQTMLSRITMNDAIS